MRDVRIEISLRLQQLALFESAPESERLLVEYPVSTALNGAGEADGSYCTPRGKHRIAQKIGTGAPLFAVFKSRVATGEIWTPQLEENAPGCDWILSRILWLEGIEAGKNQGGTVDSHARYIYIHGTNEEHKIGTPVSHGCIRMKNADVVTLYDLVEVGTPVSIND